MNQLTLFHFFRRGFFPVVGKTLLKNSFIQVSDLSSMLVAMAEQTGVYSPGPYYPDDGKGGYTCDEVLSAAAKVFGRKIRKIKVPTRFAQVVAWTSETLGDLFGKTPLLNTDKFEEISQPFWFCSGNLLRETFGVSPKILLDEGLKSACEWYEKEGWL